MQIVQTFEQRHFRLKDSFLAPYYTLGDPFKTLLARSTYVTKYARDREVWTNTIQRVVEGNIALSHVPVSEQEGEMLFHLFWTGQALPPGRGLWTGGVPGIPADARYNCWATTLCGPEDWCWVMNQLMLGGGVGVGLGSIHTLEPVAHANARFAINCGASHPDIEEIKPNDKTFLNGQTPVYRVEDSRQGWVESLRRTMQAAWEGKDLIIDVSEVRPRGRKIKIFGGIACGPGPLSNLLRMVWGTIRGAAGRKLNSIECLDITNMVGFCVKSGNVRRSALILLGDANDQAFRDAKKDFGKVLSHRHTSNNSIGFYTEEQIRDFDWAGLVDDNIKFGEPGLANLALVHKTDPGATCVNPCFSGDTKIAVADGRNAVSIKQLADEGKDVPVYSMDKVTGNIEIKMGRHPRITGYGKKLVRVWLDDDSYLNVTPDHKFVLLGGASVEAKDLKSGDSLPRFTKALEHVKEGSKDYYLLYCNTRDTHKNRVFEHRLIAKFFHPEEWSETYTACKQNGFTNTGGLVVHHRDYNQLNNAPDNLQIMAFRDHAKLHGDKDNNGESNGRWSGVSSEDIKKKALEFTSSLGRHFSGKEWKAFAKSEGLPTQFSPYRQSQLGTVLGLAKVCALDLGYEHVNEDLRVLKTYRSMIEQGYDATIIDGKVLVKKTCEGCSSDFSIEHQYRERAFCSEKCGNAYVNGDAAVKAKRLEGMHTVYRERMKSVRVEQARVCSALAFDLGREPLRKEWSLACAKESIPSRIGPALKFGYRQFTEVLEAGSLYNHKVRRVEELPGEHTVYNITVDDHHTVAVITGEHEKRGNTWFSGVVVYNCGEQFLHDREACCLGEMFPSLFESGTDASLAFKLQVRYCMRQRLTPLTDPKSHAVGLKNMRIGVALGGLCDFDWTPQVLSDWFLVCRTEANDYADVLGVNKPLTVTTVKPSGTISLLNGSSPGIHAPYAPYYIRRARIAKNDIMAPALMEAGVPHEPDQYDHTGHTLVFSFPTKAQHTRITVQTENIRDQFERQAAVQRYWADNAVSATLSFDAATEREETAQLLAQYVPQFKSTSMLAKSSHGYVQAPYEQIDQATFEAMSSKIREDHPLVRGGEIEGLDECSGGSCPVR